MNIIDKEYEKYVKGQKRLIKIIGILTIIMTIFADISFSIYPHKNEIGFLFGLLFNFFMWMSLKNLYKLYKSYEI